MSRHFQLEANMTLSGAAADSVTNVYCKSKQALVHIYNIVTGSAIAVTLDNQFKAEVTKAAMQLKLLDQRCFGFRYSR
jgi:molybdopterin-containing oxidoreductase family iron-sulfur binding subunit